MSSTQHPLIQFLKTLDGVVIPESPTATDQAQFQVKDDTLDSFEEVNLLEGLLGGMNTQFFASSLLLTYHRDHIFKRGARYQPSFNAFRNCISSKVIFPPTCSSPLPQSVSLSCVHRM